MTVSELAKRAENKILLWRIDAALAQLYKRENKVEHARSAQPRATETINMIATHVSEPGLRDSFLNSPDAQAVLNLVV